MRIRWYNIERDITNAQDGSSYEEAGRVRATDHASAAEVWAQQDDADSVDYTIVKGEPARVRVTDEDGCAKEFVVSGEAVPVYHARQVGAH